ncbi:MAG: c-type cytochrome [Chitinophagaceae bacterium]|nr:MAG: c-type cytochrome [Chitinophagaceae bacterium]
MKKIIVLGSFMSLTVWILSCNQEPAKEVAAAPVSQDSLIRRGDYLVSTMGCDDCHTPKKMGAAGPEPDMAARFSGHQAGSQLPPRKAGAGLDGWVLFNMSQTATVGPWGVSYSANITSDSTGIGSWTEQQFSNALRKGFWKGLEGTRGLMPPMPWPNYAKLTDDDVKAMYTYLKSTKPVKNVVPAWEPPAGPPPPPPAAAQ